MRALINEAAVTEITHGEFLDLQKSQLLHDQLYHPDILALRVHERTVHYTLHYAKYAARLLEAANEDDLELGRATLIDAIIITLAFCNMLNMRFEVSRKTYPVNVDFLKSVYKFVALSGKFAKTTESIDHLENMNFRAELEAHLSSLCKIIDELCCILKVDVVRDVRTRLDQVEKKSIFYSNSIRNKP